MLWLGYVILLLHLQAILSKLKKVFIKIFNRHYIIILCFFNLKYELLGDNNTILLFFLSDIEMFNLKKIYTKL